MTSASSLIVTNRLHRASPAVTDAGENLRWQRSFLLRPQIFEELEDGPGAVQPTAVVGDRDVVVRRGTTASDEPCRLTRAVDTLHRSHAPKATCARQERD